MTEQDHHGISSFRVRGKIFATVPDSDHVRVMVDEAEIRAAVAGHPQVCDEFYWGKRLACVVVDVPAIAMGFYSAGSYTFASNSEPLGTVPPPAGSTSSSTTPITTPGCGVGMTLYGKFSVQGDVITLYQQGDPGCPACTQTNTLSFEFSLLSHQALKLCDNTAGECWAYHRQPH